MLNYFDNQESNKHQTCWNGRPFCYVTLTLHTFIWLDRLVVVFLYSAARLKAVMDHMFQGSGWPIHQQFDASFRVLSKCQAPLSGHEYRTTHTNVEHRGGVCTTEAKHANVAQHPG